MRNAELNVDLLTFDLKSLFISFLYGKHLVNFQVNIPIALLINGQH
ncbi:hypothetical protein [Algoriphagus sp. PAP.12]|nr:hypothetical protein [Algoriphagus sp. PAP.12]